MGLDNDTRTHPCGPARLPTSGHGLDALLAGTGSGERAEPSVGYGFELMHRHSQPCSEVAQARTAHWCPPQANEPLISVPANTFPFALAENVTQLIPEPGSLLHSRVLQYRELLDSLPMDAYTHGCILHPELTTDSMIPKYATAEIRSKSPLQRGCPGPAGRLPQPFL